MYFTCESNKLISFHFITFQASRLPVAGRQLVGPRLVQVTICERRSVSLDHFVVHITVRLSYFFARLVHSDAFTVAGGIKNILIDCSNYLN